jgi:hypothetical protein
MKDFNMKIKNILLIIMIIILSLGIYSCESSLGYDPKVNITKIVNPTGTGDNDDTTKPARPFKVDSVRMDFKEFIRMAGMEPFSWQARVITKNIKLDTSTSDTKIWMDLALENPTPDQEYKKRGVNEKISKFDLSFEAVLNSSLYRLDDVEKNKNWFELFIKYFPQNNLISFNGSQIRADLMLIENKKDLGIITFFLNIEFTENIRNTRVAKFNGNISIFYKK